MSDDVKILTDEDIAELDRQQNEWLERQWVPRVLPKTREPNPGQFFDPTFTVLQTDEPKPKTTGKVTASLGNRQYAISFLGKTINCYSPSKKPLVVGDTVTYVHNDATDWCIKSDGGYETRYEKKLAEFTNTAGIALYMLLKDNPKEYLYHKGIAGAAAGLTTLTTTCLWDGQIRALPVEYAGVSMPAASITAGSSVLCYKKPSGWIVIGGGVVPVIDMGANPGSVVEGNPITFTATIDEAPEIEATVEYYTEDITAVAGVDYTAKTGTLTWAIGSTATKTIVVNTLTRSGVQNTRSFTVKLENPVNATIGQDFAIGSIEDTLPSTIHWNSAGGTTLYNATPIFAIPDGSGKGYLYLADGTTVLMYVSSPTAVTIPYTVSPAPTEDASTSLIFSGSSVADCTLVPSSISVSAGSTTGAVTVSVSDLQKTGTGTVSVEMESSSTLTVTTPATATFNVVQYDYADYVAWAAGGTIANDPATITAQSSAYVRTDVAMRVISASVFCQRTVPGGTITYEDSTGAISTNPAIRGTRIDGSLRNNETANDIWIRITAS